MAALSHYEVDSKMITFAIIAAAVVLLGGVFVILFMGTQHKKSVETGRRTEAPNQPARTEGRAD